jgi:sRNA-binding regulator protein Hfq
MSSHAVLPPVDNGSGAAASPYRPPSKKKSVAPLPFFGTGHETLGDTAHRQAELFYLQKQIQTQTPMVIVLEDGELIEGCIEWYDRHSLKIRGKSKTLIYKSAIKYMYKVADAGQ